MSGWLSAGLGWANSAEGWIALGTLTVLEIAVYALGQLADFCIGPKNQNVAQEQLLGFLESLLRRKSVYPLVDTSLSLRSERQTSPSDKSNCQDIPAIEKRPLAAGAAGVDDLLLDRFVY